MTQEEINHSKIKKASLFAIIVSITLCVLKFYVYKTTQSCSLHASAMDSVMDTAVSLINLFAVYMLSTKKNNLAPFGWDKIAVLVSTLQCVIITGLSLEILHESFTKLWSNSHNIENFSNIIGVSLISFFISLSLTFYQKKVIKETNSLVIKADMIHFISDIYSSLFMFIGFVFIKLFNTLWIDAVLGVIVSFYLISSVSHLLKTSLFALLDLNLSVEQEKVLKALRSHNYDFKKEDVHVTFSGARFVINITINSKLIDKVSQIRNIIQQVPDIEIENECHAHICTHVSESLKSTKDMLININVI